jgi:hypothetical protein
MEYIEIIGFTSKILKFVFAQIMFFTDKKSSVTRRRRGHFFTRQQDHKT